MTTDLVSFLSRPPICSTPSATFSGVTRLHISETPDQVPMLDTRPPVGVRPEATFSETHDQVPLLDTIPPNYVRPEATFSGETSLHISETYDQVPLLDTTPSDLVAVSFDDARPRPHFQQVPLVVPRPPIFDIPETNFSGDFPETPDQVPLSASRSPDSMVSESFPVPSSTPGPRLPNLKTNEVYSAEDSLRVIYFLGKLFSTW